MGLEAELQHAFEEAQGSGIESLTERGRALANAWAFIIDWEMGGLAGYLYNTLPDHAAIEDTIAALGSVGLSSLAELLRLAHAPFAETAHGQGAATRGQVLAEGEADSLLRDLDDQIANLHGYGIPD